MIRRANYKDIEQLLSICEEFWLSGPVSGFDAEYTERKLMSILANNCIFISEEDGVIRGMIILVFTEHLCLPEINAAEVAWYVRPEFRGGTLGAKLIMRAEEEAISVGASTLTMCYMASSMPNVVKSIYEKLGFEFFEASYLKRLK